MNGTIWNDLLARAKLPLGHFPTDGGHSLRDAHSGFRTNTAIPVSTTAPERDTVLPGEKNNWRQLSLLLMLLLLLRNWSRTNLGLHAFQRSFETVS